MSPAHDTGSELYTRIGVIGDIHTRADRLEWALGVMREHAVERVLATGDIVDGPHPEAVGHACQLLRANNALAVLGNHDRWLLDEQHRELHEATFPDDVDEEVRRFLKALPQSLELSTPHGALLLGHGLGSNDMSCLYPFDHGPSLSNNTTLQAILRENRYRFVISGHTHLRMVRDIGEVKFINAGALHYTRNPCCLVLDLHARRVQFFDQAANGSCRRSLTHAF